MKRKADKRIIGAFVLGAIALLVAALVVFGSGALFKQTDKYVLFFDGPVKGLTEGAPVIFKGVKIGTVSNISLLYNLKTKDVVIPVIIDVGLSLVKGVPEKMGYTDYNLLIEQGLRARLEIQNFITSQLMIALDFYPESQAKMYNIVRYYPELPTLPTSPDIFEIMDELPIREIANDLGQTVAGINKLINSEGFYALGSVVQELTQAARSVRMLAEYLEQHPEAILKGKQPPKERIR